MIVCICNALNDKKLSEAAGTDACSVQEVFRRCGERPQCGKCLSHVAEIIEQNCKPETATKIAAE